MQCKICQKSEEDTQINAKSGICAECDSLITTIIANPNALRYLFKSLHLKLTEEHEDFDKLRADIEQVGNDATEAFNGVERFMNTMSDALEIWNKRENENHLILVKIMEMISFLYNKSVGEDSKPEVDKATYL